VEARDSGRTDKIMVASFQENGKVRARIISDGCDDEKNCQFPRDIRKIGKKFVIDSVIDAGTFYLIRDEIAPYICPILIIYIFVLYDMLSFYQNVRVPLS
jgi:hypothetical protein